MKENAAGRTGISGIEASIDLRTHAWGGYMFLNGALARGSSNPSESWGAQNAGMDLRGATRLVFWARGKVGGERVEFFMGSLGWSGSTKVAKYPDSTKKVSLGTVKLTKGWKKYTISLAGRDLGRIGCGFGWVTNEASNPGRKAVAFYLDDIYYEYATARIRPMFLQSYASAKPGTKASIINNFAYLYDNAAAAMALSYAGYHARSRQIADAIVYAAGNDRTYAAGRLRNAYSAGDPRSFPGWASGKSTAFARMPGFWSTKADTWYEDFYADSTSTGTMAWAVMALCEVYRRAPAASRTKYMTAARQIAAQILTLKDARGGFTGGWEGWDGKATTVTYKSTEHNIDLITAFGALAALCPKGRSAYRAAASHARQFVMSMYDSQRRLFRTGTTADGVTPNTAVWPLDTNTWTILALRTGLTDRAKIMASVQRTMAVGKGYDFDTDRDGVWYEGTAQAALAWKVAGNTVKYRSVLAFLNSRRSASGSITAADRNGVTTGFLVAGTKEAWTYDRRTHVGATAWLSFAQTGRNPFVW